MFWPTYNLEPWKTGITFHAINEQIDSGPIFHQSIANLNQDDGVHETALNAMIAGRNDVLKLTNYIIENDIEPIKQPFFGRTYFKSQLRAEHLLTVYKDRENRTIKYLNNLGIYKRPFKIYSVLN